MTDSGVLFIPTMYRGDTFVWDTPRGLGDVSVRTEVIWAVKLTRYDGNADALWLVTESLGLVTVNGQAPQSPITAADAKITFLNEATGFWRIEIQATATQFFTFIGQFFWDLQVQFPGPPSTQVTSRQRGRLKLALDITEGVF